MFPAAPQETMGEAGIQPGTAEWEPGVSQWEKYIFISYIHKL
jgi:hypothetical protein